MSKTLQIPSHVFLEAADVKLCDKRRVEMEAYTGAVFDVGFGPAVAELSGIKAGKSVPLFRQHDPNRFVGRSDDVSLTGGKLIVRGFLFDNDDAVEVASLSDQGAEWQASVGLTFGADDLEYVMDGDRRTVNGRNLAGPFILIKGSELKEVSFVPLGADPNTRAVALGEQSHFVTLQLGAKMDPNADALKSERERVSAIRAEFAADPDFCLSAIVDGISLQDAKLKWATKVEAKLAETQKALEAERQAQAEKIADLEARLAAKASYASETVTQDTKTQHVGDAKAEWNAAVDAEFAQLWDQGSQGLKRGGGQNKVSFSRRACVRAEAIQNVSKRNPDLHKAFLAASNPSRFAQEYYENWRGRGSN